VHPFLSYEVAKGIVRDVDVTSERRRRWRRDENQALKPVPSWDTEATRLLLVDSREEQERVGA
jgi:hypothetical protein